MDHRLTDDEVTSYHLRGFVEVDELVDRGAVDELRVAYDALIDAEVPSAGDRLLGGLTRQVMLPSAAHPTFADNGALRAGMAVGAQLVGEPVERVFDMLIFKPPLHPHETPWHQDMAYAGMPTAPAGSDIPLLTMQFWVALDDVDVENGCMHFVPGFHRRPLLAHRVAGGEPDDPGRLLALCDPDGELPLERAVAVPLRAGDCTVHSYGTPHHTPPNRSPDRPRRAYIFNLAPTSFLDSFRPPRDGSG